MADLSEQEIIAIAEAEVEAAAAEEEAKKKASQPELSTMDRVLAGLKKAPGALYEGVKQTGEGLYNLGNRLAASPNPAVIELGKAAIENPATSIRLAATAPAAFAGPVVGPVLATGLNYGASKLNQALGLEEPTTGGQDVEDAATTFGASVIPLAGAKLVGAAVKAAPVGRTGALYQHLNEDGSIVAKHNAPKGTTARESIFADNAIEYQPEFEARNPMAGLDPKKPFESLKQYQANLGNLVENGVKTKKDIIKQMALKEESSNQSLLKAGQVVEPEAGLALRDTDLDLSKLDKLKVGATDATVAGVEAAKQELLSEFYEPKIGLDQNSRYVTLNQPDFTKPKIRSISEYDEVLKKIDGRIEELGGYDESYLANKGLNPSVIDSQIGALRIARRSLADGMSKYIDRNLGPEAAQALSTANDDIAVGLRYGKLAKRFSLENLQSLAPGSGRSLQNATQNAPKTIADIVMNLGKSQETQQILEGVKRARDLIRDSQRIISWKQGGSPPLLARDWDLVRTNPTAMTALSNALAVTGIDPTPLLNGSDEEKKQAFTKAAEMVPALFEKPEGGYSSLVNGKLHNPADKDMHMRSILDSKLGYEDEAKAMGALLERSEYVPVGPRSQVILQPQRPLNLSDMLGAFDNTTIRAGGENPQINSGQNETSKMIESMKRSQAMINTDASGF